MAANSGYLPVFCSCFFFFALFFFANEGICMVSVKQQFQPKGIVLDA